MNKEHFQIFLKCFLSFIFSLLDLEEEGKFLNYCLKDLGRKTHVLAMRTAHDVNGSLRDLQSTFLVTLR